MKISVGDVVGCVYLNVEVDGVLQSNVVDLDIETGEATVYKRDTTGIVLDADWNATLEKVIFPVDKLHVYLVKPK